jgi:N-acetylglucosamine kinase-like BadF-type ATPase
MMINNNFFVGIDSGGTKSEILIADDCNILSHNKSCKALHYSLHGQDKIINHIKNIIIASLKEKKLNLKNCKGICIGLAGVREKKDKIEIEKLLKRLIEFKNIIVESDADIALHGAFKGNNGLILICGTGSILYGYVDGIFYRIGGWGRTIGDYGSGYEIGKYAIKHLVSEYDKNKKLSNISRIIEKKFSFNRTNILNKIYQNNFDVQHIAPVVLEQANKKDKNAIDIIDKAVDDLLCHFETFFAVSGLRNKIDLALSGSIIENENVLSHKLKKQIKKNFKLITIIKKMHTPVEGAILLAKNKFLKN